MQIHIDIFITIDLISPSTSVSMRNYKTIQDQETSIRSLLPVHRRWLLRNLFMLDDLVGQKQVLINLLLLEIQEMVLHL